MVGDRIKEPGCALTPPWDHVEQGLPCVCKETISSVYNIDAAYGSHLPSFSHYGARQTRPPHGLRARSEESLRYGLPDNSQDHWDSTSSSNKEKSGSGRTSPYSGVPEINFGPLAGMFPLYSITNLLSHPTIGQTPPRR